MKQICVSGQNDSTTATNRPENVKNQKVINSYIFRDMLFAMSRKVVRIFTSNTSTTEKYVPLNSMVHQCTEERPAQTLQSQSVLALSSVGFVISKFWNAEHQLVHEGPVTEKTRQPVFDPCLRHSRWSRWDKSSSLYVDLLIVSVISDGCELTNMITYGFAYARIFATKYLFFVNERQSLVFTKLFILVNL